MPAGETADLLALSAVCPGVAAAAALAKDAAFTLRGLIARAIRDHAMAAKACRRAAADARDAVGPTTAARAARAARALDRRDRSA